MKIRGQFFSFFWGGGRGKSRLGAFGEAKHRKD